MALIPNTLSREISPPPTRRRSHSTRSGVLVAITDPSDDPDTVLRPDLEPTPAIIEAGQAQVRNHLRYFAKHLSSVSRQSPGPRLGIADFQDLYQRNNHPRGRHFVIHQHDHPISGVHYDLRLQFSNTSCLSFALPYGLPGNPNSIRPNRMAVETRVHNLWNNLVESASQTTGSLLIWDTGEYEILLRTRPQTRVTDDELSDIEDESADAKPEHERLIAAFQSRHMSIRFHGTRLPPGYTIDMRLPSNDHRAHIPHRPKIKRRRKDRAIAATKLNALADSDSDEDSTIRAPADVMPSQEDDNGAANASEAEDEDSTIRLNNAYPGSSNTIGSIHQRHWFLTLDRRRSGFRYARNGPNAGRWVGSWPPFYVYGRDSERSLISGRTADEILSDEGVQKFVGRKMWRPILE